MLRCRVESEVGWLTILLWSCLAMHRQLDYLSMRWLGLDGQSADVAELQSGVGRLMRAEGGGQ